MIKTNHDLSGDKAILSLSEIENALARASGLALWHVESKLRELQESKNNLSRVFASQQLADLTDSMEKINVSLHYVKEAQSRFEIVLKK